jgi:hypothetical protein
MAAPLLRALALAAVLAPLASAQAAPVCNGRADLCGRRYNQVTYAATHDSYAVLKYVDKLHKLIPLHQLVTYIGFVDQDGTITDQLNAGIRAFDLRLVADEKGTPQLCHARHSECQSEGKFLSFVKEALKHPTHAKEQLNKAFDNAAMAFSSPDAVFAEFGKWVAAHPNEVVTISASLVSNNISVDFVDGLLTRHGLKKFLQGHTKDQDWPTLGDMIKSGKRLVVFSGGGKGDIIASSGATNEASMSKGWSDKWKTADVVSDCGALTAADFKSDTLVSFDHHLTMSIARLKEPGFNTKSLRKHLAACIDKYKKAPTYIYVDFYKDSWAVKLAGEANSGAVKP